MRKLGILTICLLCAPLVSCKYDPTLVNGEEVTISGKIKRVGNEPFTSLAISIADNQTLYLVFNNPEDKIDFENKIDTWQTLNGTILIETLHTVDGKKSMKRYSLFME